MDFLLALLFAVFMLPLVTGHAAKQMGRSLWKWFLIGCILPGISFLILAVLPEERKETN